MGSIEMDIAPVWVDLPEHITNSPKLHVYVFAQPPTREKNTTARGYWMLIDLADNVDTEENEDTDGE